MKRYFYKLNQTCNYVMLSLLDDAEVQCFIGLLKILSIRFVVFLQIHIILLRPVTAHLYVKFIVMCRLVSL